MHQMAGTVAGFPDAAAGGGPVACRPFRVAAGQASDPGVVAVQLWHGLCRRTRACQQLAADRIVMASAANGMLMAPGTAGAAGSVLRDRLGALDGGAGCAAPLSP